MPLSILLPLVIGGIAGIALLLHLLGLSNPAAIPDDAAARRAWRREYPDDPPVRVMLCRARSAALIETARGHGVVWTMGADTTARALADARVRRVRTGLTLDLPDYTAPRIRLRLSPEEAERWQAILEAA
ncbi:MAG: hypothetical protein CVT70_06765 [Alphaproteobacteria bacterium HGW-Alphaproteobacteria-1]|jgi:hypothetical protein|nr:MAG: hypothetical protein CVT70_06765 [Alphaproteobacteria bacterium HGW-Alphaproteobacteria-1]